MDGTLAGNSEVLAMKVAVRAASDALGVPFDASLCTTLAGLTFRHIVDEIGKIHGKQLNAVAYAELAESQQKETLRVLSKRVRLAHGVYDLLEFAESEGIQPALITSSSLDRVNVLLERDLKLPRSLRSFFGKRIFSAEDPEIFDEPRSKPLPDIYLHYLDAVGADPEEALFIEDSPSGVASGLDAGIECGVGYVGGAHIPVIGRPAYAERLNQRAEQHGGSLVITPSMREIRTIIEQVPKHSSWANLCEARNHGRSRPSLGGLGGSAELDRTGQLSRQPLR